MLSKEIGKSFPRNLKKILETLLTIFSEISEFSVGAWEKIQDKFELILKKSFKSPEIEGKFERKILFGSTVSYLSSNYS